MNIFITILLFISAFAASPAKSKKEKVFKLPSYSPNNPMGQWANLPRGKNYIFCGDRVLFGSNFKEKVRVQYGSEEKFLSILEHCELRRIELERLSKARTSEEPTLVELQFDKLNSHFKKIQANKLNRKGHIYSLKDIRKVMSASEINSYRASNLMLPVLDLQEFGKLYAGDTNNPQFIKTEYDRYFSNLTTQNVAMLYTTSGLHYYFSFNLSNDQLKLLARVLGGSSGGSGSGGGGSSSGGSKSSGGSASPQQIARAIDDIKQQPFDGFMTGRANLQVKPEATTLPAFYGLDDTASFVPYDINVPKLSVRRGYSGKGSDGRSSVDRVTSVGLSANPFTSMLSQNRSAANVGSNLSPRASQTYTQTAPRRSDTSSRSVASEPVTPVAANGSKSVSDMQKDLVEGLSAPTASVAINFADLDNVQFASPDIGCKQDNWEQLAFLQFDSRVDQSKLNPSNENCFLESINTQFCGQGKASESYTGRCVNEDMKIRSCYNQMTIDVAKICKRYIKISGEITKEEITSCIEAMSALACNQIPCEISTDNKTDGKINFLEPVLYNNGEDLLSKGFSEKLLGFEDIKKISRISGSNDFNLYPSSPGGGPPSKKRLDLMPLLNQDSWPHGKQAPSKRLFMNDLVKLSLYYKYNISNKCDFDNGSIQKALDATN